MCCGHDCLVDKRRLQCMQGMSEYALIMVSSAIGHALKCAGRSTGPCTTFIRICTHAVANSMYNAMRGSGSLTGDSILPNVVCLELVLEHFRMAMYDDHASASGLRAFCCRECPTLLQLDYGTAYPSPRPLCRFYGCSISTWVAYALTLWAACPSLHSFLHWRRPTSMLSSQMRILIQSQSLTCRGAGI